MWWLEPHAVTRRPTSRGVPPSTSRRVETDGRGLNSRFLSHVGRTLFSDPRTSFSPIRRVSLLVLTRSRAISRSFCGLYSDPDHPRTRPIQQKNKALRTSTGRNTNTTGRRRDVNQQLGTDKRNSPILTQAPYLKRITKL